MSYTQFAAHYFDKIHHPDFKVGEFDHFRICRSLFR